MVSGFVISGFPVRQGDVEKLLCGRREGVQTCGRGVERQRAGVVVRASAEEGMTGGEAAGAAGATDGTDLILATISGVLSNVKEQLASGVDVNATSAKFGEGMTALMWAASEGHVEVAKVLLEAGANVRATNASGYDPLMFALEGMPRVGVYTPPPAGYPDLAGKEQPKQMKFVARDTGHLGIVKLLLLANADVKTKVPVTGDTVLHLAAARGQLGLVELFCSLNLPVNATNAGFWHTPLHDAVIKSHAPVVKFLLQHGANVNAQNRVGWTPLIWAAGRGDVEMVDLLCKAGANVNLRGEGSTKATKTDALKEGSKSRNPREIRRILIKYGAK